MGRSLSDIIRGTQDAQELYWAALLIDLLSHHLDPKTLRKRSADLERQRVKFGVVDPGAYPWGPPPYTWSPPTSLPEPAEV